MEPEPIYSRKKGSNAVVIATCDAEFRAGFDRKITQCATDFMNRSKQEGKPFYMYLPYTRRDLRGICASAVPDRLRMAI